jgi:hypothetical protein
VEPAASVRWTLHPKSYTRRREKLGRGGGEIPVHMSQGFFAMFGREAMAHVRLTAPELRLQASALDHDDRFSPRLRQVPRWAPS